MSNLTGVLGQPAFPLLKRLQASSDFALLAGLSDVLPDPTRPACWVQASWEWSTPLHSWPLLVLPANTMEARREGEAHSRAGVSLRLVAV